MPLISSIHVCPLIPFACFDFLFYNSFITSYLKKKNCYALVIQNILEA